MCKLFIVMPAYNEADNIEKVVEQWHSVAERINAEGNQCRIIIANDGSIDNTWDILSSLKSRFDCLSPINKLNSGHGATVLYLYRYALADGADFIFQTDSDGQTNPDEFWNMWQNRKKFDLQIGSREHRMDGLSRIFVTRVLRLLILIQFRVWIKDANTPFRLMNSQKLIEIIKLIPNDFFLANVAVSVIAVRLKMRIGWYPVTFLPRQGGENSINMRKIIKIGFQSLREFRVISKSL